MNIDIPQRAKNEADFPQLKVLDKRIIAYAVLCQTGNEEAFMRFHPEYLRADGKGMNDAGKTESKHFWSYGKNREYRQAYEATLEEFFGRRQTNRSVDTDIDDSRKDKALKSLLSQAMSLVEGSADLDAETIKMCSDIFTKLGLIKSTEEQQEKPRRYIPIRCRQECQYRFFVEKHVETGEIVSDCEYCKALAIAKEHGYHYDPTTNLSIPEETETPKENNPE